MTDVWTTHARTSGRRAVISPDISEEEFDRVTREQVAYLTPLIDARQPVLDFGRGWAVLDYGCGPGRFAGLLRKSAAPWCLVGFDPCEEYRNIARPLYDYMWSAIQEVGGQFSLVFVWLVLGGIPDDDVPKIADEIVSCLAPGGLLIFGEHCESQKQEGKWWRFRQPVAYEVLFAARGVEIAKIGEVDQIGNFVTVFAGRKAA